MPLPLDLPPMIEVAQAATPYQVAAQRYEVMFKDGSTVGLFQVWQHGAPVLMLRAIQFGGLLMVFDVTLLARELDEALRVAHPRDQAGTIFYTLRSKYPTADEFIAAVVRSKPKAQIIQATSTARKAEAVAA